jgi:glycosyltransferase involved in cell wall biosynthesis
MVPLKIAILGTRGVPPNYGGFETFAAEMGVRLIARGHEVTVYCREPGPDVWQGIRRIVLPSFGAKYLETVTHSLFSSLDALRRDFDVVLVCNAANAFVLRCCARRVSRSPSTSTESRGSAASGTLRGGPCTRWARPFPSVSRAGSSPTQT